jgi:hypothetical protein
MAVCKNYVCAGRLDTNKAGMHLRACCHKSPVQYLTHTVCNLLWHLVQPHGSQPQALQCTGQVIEGHGEGGRNVQRHTQAVKLWQEAQRQHATIQTRLAG